MSEAVTIAIIGGVVSLASLAMTLLIKKDVKEAKGDMKETKEKVDNVHTQMNGMKDKLVEQAGQLGEHVGKEKGRQEVLNEINSEPAKVIFLDDNEDDLLIIEKSLKVCDLAKYKMYEDVDSFLTDLTREKAVYVIDDGLPHLSGLSILDKIINKNQQNFTILLTGNRDESIVAKYTNDGIDRIVFKEDSGQYLKDLCKYIKEGLRLLTDRK